METNLTPEFLTAFSKFQNNCDPIPLNQTVKVKTKGGGAYSFKYADLGQIHEIINPLLADAGLGFFQAFQGKALITVVYSTDGGLLVSNYDLADHMQGKGAQEAGGVITYFKRYTLAALLGIITEEDDDANTSSGNTIENKEPAKPWLNPGTTQWGEAVKYLSADGTIDAILKKYAISKVNREKLLSESI